MATGTRTVLDVISIMRKAISRQNENDPASTNATLLSYVNDFVSLSMPSDIRVPEKFGTLSFTIDETVTDGVYTFNDVGLTVDFMDISNSSFISEYDPVNESTTWNSLTVYVDPKQFYDRWGINNIEVLTAGFPTEVLFYGNEFVFRTIPDTTYLINMYGYKKNANYESSSDNIDYDYWLRYLAYGAALNYAHDYNFSVSKLALIEKGYLREKTRLFSNVHNRIKHSRCSPNF